MYLLIRYKDGKEFSQIVQNITPDKLEALRDHPGVVDVRVIGQTR